MQTETYECVEYKSRLYKTTDEILLLDIFVNNKEKHIIKLSSCKDNIITYDKYKTYYKYYYMGYKLGYDYDEDIKKIDSIKIKLNKIFTILKDYDTYNGDCKKNLISLTLIKKGLLNEFTAQIDEDKINIKWMTSWMKY